MSEAEPDTYPTPPHGWTCFHCGEHFEPHLAGQKMAREHFGVTPDYKPGCIIKLQPGDRRLMRRIRWLEGHLARYQNEDSDKDRQMAAMSADHAGELRAEEEKGYARGLRDSRNDAAIEEGAKELHRLSTAGRQIAWDNQVPEYHDHMRQRVRAILAACSGLTEA